MSIEFRWLDYKKRLTGIVLLDDEDFVKLSPILAVVHSKTGLNIDPYSDTRLSPDHIDMINSLIIDSGLKESPNLYKLTKMLEIAIENSWWILVVGD